MLKIIRLKTGDELLGVIENIDFDSENTRQHATIEDLPPKLTTITNPLILGIIPKEEKIVFLDLLLYSDHKQITVRTDDIIFIIEPRKEMIDKHTSFWSEKEANIIVPENKIIS